VFQKQVIDAFPWADLLLADDTTKLVIESPVSKAAARIRYAGLSAINPRTSQLCTHSRPPCRVVGAKQRATEVLARQENIKKNMSWISRLILPSIAPSKIKKGQTPHVYDAALDAYIHNDFDKLLSTPSGEKLTEVLFFPPWCRRVCRWSCRVRRVRFDSSSVRAFVIGHVPPRGAEV
jgi:hypothetical protein